MACQPAVKALPERCACQPRCQNADRLRNPCQVRDHALFRRLADVGMSLAPEAWDEQSVANLLNAFAKHSQVPLFLICLCPRPSICLCISLAGFRAFSRKKGPSISRSLSSFLTRVLSSVSLSLSLSLSWRRRPETSSQSPTSSMPLLNIRRCLSLSLFGLCDQSLSRLR